MQSFPPIPPIGIESDQVVIPETYYTGEFSTLNIVNDQTEDFISPVIDSPPDDASEEQCDYVFTRGIKKGQRCDNKADLLRSAHNGCVGKYCRCCLMKKGLKIHENRKRVGRMTKSACKKHVGRMTKSACKRR